MRGISGAPPPAHQKTRLKVALVPVLAGLALVPVLALALVFVDCGRGCRS